MDDREVRQLVARAEVLLEEIEAVPDPRARSTAVEMVQVLFDLYGEGLARMVEKVGRTDGEGLLNAFAEDELVGHLLLLHGLHPVDVETRVQQALQEVRPFLESHGGDVELLGVAGDVAHLRLLGSCNGCAASATTLKVAVEKAVQKAAPDLAAIEAEGAAGPPARQGAFIPVSALFGAEGNG